MRVYVYISASPFSRFFSYNTPATNEFSAFSARHARSCQVGRSVIPGTLPCRSPPKHGKCTPNTPLYATKLEWSCGHRREVHSTSTHNPSPSNINFHHLNLPACSHFVCRSVFPSLERANPDVDLKFLCVISTV